MGHIELTDITYTLPDGRVLLDDICFRVAEKAVVALVGANGSGKTTLLRIIAGDLEPDSGVVVRSGGLGVMRQFIGSIRDETTIRELCFQLLPQRVREASAAVDALELALMDDDSEALHMKYAHAINEFIDAGGYEQEILFDECTQAALGIPFERCKHREVNTLSGGEQKRLALEVLLRGPDQVLLLDEPDNYLDVPGKRWLEAQLQQTNKSILLVSHDRELLNEAATAVASLELGSAGNTLWVHGGKFATFHEARAERFARFEELRKRWDEKHAQLKRLVQDLRGAAASSDKMANRYHAAQTRLAKFEEAGPPQAIPLRQKLAMRLSGSRTGKRSLVATKFELTNLMKPFDCEIWLGDRVAILGSNGSGKSHFLRAIARGGSFPDPANTAVDAELISAVEFSGKLVLGARVRPGWFAQTNHHPELLGKTLLDILGRGDDHRDGMGREQAARALDRYGLAAASEQRFETLSGGQQARLQILLLELGGATLLLLDEPTDNLDIESAENLEEALEAFEGTVLCVTHDRWFARGFDRFLLFRSDGKVVEVPEPVWDETRVVRQRG